MARLSPRPAFTLVVIAVPITLLLPALQRVRKAAKRSRFIYSLNPLLLAVHNLHDEFKAVPPLDAPNVSSATRVSACDPRGNVTLAIDW